MHKDESTNRLSATEEDTVGHAITGDGDGIEAVAFLKSSLCRHWKVHAGIDLAAPIVGLVPSEDHQH